MKRKLVDAFDGNTEPKAPRLQQPTTLPIPVLTQKPDVHQPIPTDLDLQNVMRNFVNIYEKLDPSDEPLLKPNYSYTELVYLAVLRSPNFCLPIGEIYRYVQSRFVFFRNNTRLHWRNAIRHSLSKTKCFTKINLGRGANGGSNRSCFLWSIIPSSIINFARGDYRPNVDRDSGTNTLRWGYYHTNAGNFWDQVAVVLENKMDAFRASVATCASPTKMFQEQLCDLPVRQGENFAPAAPQVVVSQQSLEQTSSCQSPTVFSTPQATCLQTPTPPPNVVIQPNGQIYSSTVNASYNSYSSSTPISYHAIQRDQTQESRTNIHEAASSPVIPSYDRQPYAFTPNSHSTYANGCYQTVNTRPSGCSYLQNSISREPNQIWNQQSPVSSGTLSLHNSDSSETTYLWNQQSPESDPSCHETTPSCNETTQLWNQQSPESVGTSYKSSTSHETIDLWNQSPESIGTPCQNSTTRNETIHLWNQQSPENTEAHKNSSSIERNHPWYHPNPEGTKNSTSMETNDLWTQLSPDSTGTPSSQTSFEKDSGIDLESFCDSIHDWVPIYQTDSKPVYLASGTQIALSSIQTNILPEFATLVQDSVPLDLSVVESSSAKASDFDLAVNTLPETSSASARDFNLSVAALPETSSARVRDFVLSVNTLPETSSARAGEFGLSVTTLPETSSATANDFGLSVATLPETSSASARDFNISIAALPENSSARASDLNLLRETSSAKTNPYEHGNIYSHVTYPEYNFNPTMKSISGQVYSFAAGSNNYQAMPWFQS